MLANGVLMVLFVVDVDGPEHAADDEWWRSERDKLDRLFAQHPGGFVFRTRGGYRLIYVLAAPIVLSSFQHAEQWKLRYVGWVDYLKATYGIAADLACKDWTRLYRLPRVVRDGERQEREVIGDPAAIGAWDVQIELAAQATFAHARERAELGPLLPGERHAALLRLAGGMRRQGADEVTISSALEQFNATRCSPPKAASELHEITAFVCSKPPGPTWSLTDREPPPEYDEREPSAVDADKRGSEAARHAEIDANRTEAPRRTEIGNAQRLARMFGHELRYVAERGQWFAWDGMRWKRDLLAAEVRAKKVVERLFLEASELAALAASDPERYAERSKFAIKWANLSAKANGVSAMVSLAQSEEQIRACAEAFDRDPFALNVLNGTLDLRTGELRPHRPEDMITKLAPTAYHAGARAPLWRSFLARVLPDAGVRSFVQRYFGYALTGDVREQVLAFLYGRGQNGKSVLIDVLLEIMGDYGLRAAPDLVLSKHGESHPTELADLEGKRLVVASEVEQDRAWAEATIKRITGDATISARRMRTDFYSFPATHKLVIAANTRPKVVGTDNGIWRRMRLVPFEVTIPAHERDPQLMHKLRSEHEGILAWSVEGCLAWQREGLATPAAVTAATEGYRVEQDSIGQWIEDHCVLMPEAWAPTTSLHGSYLEWCRASGHAPLERDAFRERLLEREGITYHRRNSGRGLKGIGLRSSSAEGAAHQYASDA